MNKMDQNEKIDKNNKKAYFGIKKLIPTIKTLNMLKMEKNFIALEKGYPRQPYTHWDLDNLIHHIQLEADELKEAYNRRDFINMNEEIADISNLCDYIHEIILNHEDNLINPLFSQQKLVKNQKMSMGE